LRTVKRAFLRGYGAQIQAAISYGTRNRFTAFGCGFITTLFLQSSTATALLASSFVGRGLMTVSAGLAIMIGADIGTAIIAQILSLDMRWLAPLLLSTGIIFHLIYDDGNQKRFAARIVMGLGFVLTGLAIIRVAAAPLAASETLPLILAPLEAEPILALILAVILTYILHSSLSAILILTTFAASGVLSLELAIVFIIGANLGAGLIPLIAVMRDTPQAFQVPLGNLIMRLTVALITMIAMPYAVEYLDATDWANAQKVLAAHIGFNLLLAFLFMPFIRQIAALCQRLSPSKESEEDLQMRPRYLDKKALSSPAAALSCATRETLHMAELLEDMLDKSFYALSRHDEAAIKEIIQKDEVLDSIFAAIKDYIIRLTREELSDREADQSMRIMNFATNLEYCGDIIENSLMVNARKMVRRNDKFSAEGLKEIKSFHDKVYANLKLAQSIFLSSDPVLARQLLDYKKGLVKAERDSMQNHMARLREGLPQTVATSGIHTDVLRDFRRINTYITAIAYGVLSKDDDLKRK
jgi:phosphate:Na+ symporter